MGKKKKSMLEKLFEFQAKPLKILAKETVKGIKEGLNDKEKKRE
jgi:hypothetical protein